VNVFQEWNFAGADNLAAVKLTSHIPIIALQHEVKPMLEQNPRPKFVDSFLWQAYYEIP
jgi:hypothetical protein